MVWWRKVSPNLKSWSGPLGIILKFIQLQGGCEKPTTTCTVVKNRFFSKSSLQNIYFQCLTVLYVHGHQQNIGKTPVILFPSSGSIFRSVIRHLRCAYHTRLRHTKATSTTCRQRSSTREGNEISFFGRFWPYPANSGHFRHLPLCANWHLKR